MRFINILVVTGSVSASAIFLCTSCHNEWCFREIAKKKKKNVTSKDEANPKICLTVCTDGAGCVECCYA